MISHFKLVVLLAVSTVSYCRYSGLRRDNYSTCDLTPSQLDSIIQDAKNKLQEGILIYYTHTYLAIYIAS